MTQNYNILSLDGGGIRGLLTATLINGLPAAALQNTTVFAGTSTGGIIAVCLAAGTSPLDLVGLYSSKCSSIFGSNLSPAASEDQIKDYLKLVIDDFAAREIIWGLIKLKKLPVNLFSAKYNPSGLKGAISGVLGAKVSNLVSQTAHKLFVTTFQLGGAGNGPWLPVSIDNILPTSNDATLLDAALCTSAAETYFPPHLHPTLGYCVDGGTFANNPSTFVLARAMQAGIDPKDIRILSLGTGATVNAIPPSYFSTVAPELWGLYQWAFPPKAPPTVGSMPVLGAMTDGTSEVNDEQSMSILGPQYLRVEIPLQKPITLDSCAEVPAMTQIANAFMQTTEWTDAMKWVGENFV